MKPLLEIQKEILKTLDSAASRKPETPEVFCCFCRFCIMPQNQIKMVALDALCTAPKAEGCEEEKLYRLIDGQRRHVRCFDMRLQRTACGEAGVWFERKDPTEHPDAKHVAPNSWIRDDFDV